MKVVSSQTMTDVEAKAYEHGNSGKDFMENAGRGIALATEQFIQKHQIDHHVWLLCGKGNNGGDAFVAGRYLLEKGYHVTAIQIDDREHCSSLCQQNRDYFLEKNGELINQIPLNFSKGLILDGIFGTGFKGKILPPYEALIDGANQSGLPILAIDIPSGLNGTTGEVEGSVIHATSTLFLGLPKTGFFLKESWNVVGKLQGINFGLPESMIAEITGDFELLTEDFIAHLLPPIKRNRHKYQTGDVIGLAGSPTMPGAALLSSLSAFRGGSGLVRLLHPEGMETELAMSPYELIKIPYSYENAKDVIPLMQKAAANFVGPGLGRSKDVEQFLHKVIPFLEKPCVIDADALILFSNESFKLPPHSIFTPHMGEMQTLLKSPDRLNLNADLLKICQHYAEEHDVTLILKGAPTFIFHPHTPIFVNPTGDPGMATAGSGDVLTGLLSSLLAQGLSCHEAALLGVYVHGLSGEFAAHQRGTSYGMMASDLIAHFPAVYGYLQDRSKRQIYKNS